jgi:hypothetical protein
MENLVKNLITSTKELIELNRKKEKLLNQLVKSVFYKKLGPFSEIFRVDYTLKVYLENKGIKNFRLASYLDSKILKSDSVENCYIVYKLNVEYYIMENEIFSF